MVDSEHIRFALYVLAEETIFKQTRVYFQGLIIRFSRPLSKALLESVVRHLLLLSSLDILLALHCYFHLGPFPVRFIIIRPVLQSNLRPPLILSVFNAFFTLSYCYFQFLIPSLSFLMPRLNYAIEALSKSY